MRVRLILVLSMLCSVAVPACAQDAESETVRQVSTVQAHLKAMEPPADHRVSAVPTLTRLVGKFLSEQIKDVRIEWDLDPTPAPSASMQQQGALHFNRRAEICYDNYRVGLRRDGVVMRYELTF